MASDPLPMSVKTADLPRRLLSAVAMLALAALAVAIGGAALDAFIVLVALVAFGEFALLVTRATPSLPVRLVAWAAGAAYFGLAAAILVGAGTFLLLMVVGITVFTDTGAYFTGRALGGPKIAPRISPSKTWAGLIGGMVASVAWVFLWVAAMEAPFGWPRFELGLNLSPRNVTGAVALGAGMAVVAQAGDFFESWLKRRAGVKDSSRLIPGHGGVFDRIDGLIPVVLVAGFIASNMVV
ncbi:MAG TPA: phosphatidate cytidylyltransferase [Croceibacterium sp.]|nr:phosphatidate cytidylyltransferase [Propylenella sp.]HYD25663.1 phosphatidate cytidylyltransferase [Croceibacterium sp.]